MFCLAQFAQPYFRIVDNVPLMTSGCSSHDRFVREEYRVSTCASRLMHDPSTGPASSYICSPDQALLLIHTISLHPLKKSANSLHIHFFANRRIYSHYAHLDTHACLRTISMDNYNETKRLIDGEAHVRASFEENELDPDSEDKTGSWQHLKDWPWRRFAIAQLLLIAAYSAVSIIVVNRLASWKCQTRSEPGQYSQHAGTEITFPCPS